MWHQGLSYQQFGPLCCLNVSLEDGFKCVILSPGGNNSSCECYIDGFFAPVFLRCGLNLLYSAMKKEWCQKVREFNPRKSETLDCRKTMGEKQLFTFDGRIPKTSKNREMWKKVVILWCNERETPKFNEGIISILRSQYICLVRRMYDLTHTFYLGEKLSCGRMKYFVRMTDLSYEHQSPR